MAKEKPWCGCPRMKKLLLVHGAKHNEHTVVAVIDE
jgi:hypothetical protein